MKLLEAMSCYRDICINSLYIELLVYHTLNFHFGLLFTELLAFLFMSRPMFKLTFLPAIQHRLTLATSF